MNSLAMVGRTATSRTEKSEKETPIDETNDEGGFCRSSEEEQRHASEASRTSIGKTAEKVRTGHARRWQGRTVYAKVLFHSRDRTDRKTHW